ncbi:MAG: DUF4221 family protein [Cyclobacterium sp.]
MSFSMDTVMVDSKDEILFLNGWLSQSFLSPDHRYLYNFNHFDYTLEKIDLDELRLIEKIPFEKQGPNGIGERVFTIFPVNTDSLYFGSYTGVGGIFTWKGKKVMDLPLNKLGEPSGHFSGNEQLDRIKGFADDSLVFYGMATLFDTDEYELAIIDGINKEIKRIPTVIMERVRPFKVTFTDGPSKSSVYPGSYLVLEGGKVILGSGVSNELYVLDQATDTLLHYTYESRIMPAEKSGVYRNEVSSEKEMNAVYRSINEEISYGAPFWDAEKGFFYRFSSMGEYNPNSQKPMQDLSPDRARVYLSVYDKNLALIGESLVTDLKKVPGKYFAKDGKIWIFENMEDEMGFVRLSFNL